MSRSKKNFTTWLSGKYLTPEDAAYYIKLGMTWKLPLGFDVQEFKEGFPHLFEEAKKISSGSKSSIKSNAEELQRVRQSLASCSCKRRVEVTQHSARFTPHTCGE